MTGGERAGPTLLPILDPRDTTSRQRPPTGEENESVRGSGWIGHGGPGRRAVESRRDRVPEDDAGPHSAPEDRFRMGDLAFEARHRRDDDGDTAPCELGWRSVGERDARAEHGNVIDPALPVGRVALNAADSVPAGTKALDPTA